MREITHHRLRNYACTAPEFIIQELRAKQVVDRLTSLVHTTVSVCRDGAWREVSLEELVAGDLVRLGAGLETQLETTRDYTNILFCGSIVRNINRQVEADYDIIRITDKISAKAVKNILDELMSTKDLF